MGVTVEDYEPIYTQKQGVHFSGVLAGADANCTVWADILSPGEAEVLATYTGAYAGKAAISRNGSAKAKLSTSERISNRRISRACCSRSLLPAEFVVRSMCLAALK